MAKSATVVVTMFNALAKMCHKTAVDKGFYDEPVRSFGEAIALMHSELSEALEEHRDGQPLLYFRDDKPEGVAIEFADLIIRVLDTAHYMGIDLDKAVMTKMAYNQTRPHKHGRKVY